MAAEEPEGDDGDARNNERQRAGHRQCQPGQHDDEHGPQHPAPSEAPGEVSDERRAERSDQVDAEQEPHRGLTQAIRRRHQAIADVVVNGDECSEQHETLREQPRQSRVGEGSRKPPHEHVELERSRHEAPGGRKAPREHHGASQSDRAHRGHRPAPAEEIRHDPGQQPPAQTTDGAPSYVEAHTETDGFRMDLLAEIGHRNRRQPAQCKAEQGAKRQQREPAGRDCSEQVRSAEQSVDAAMICLRPRASETAPANNSATAITPVGNESESALPASLTP